MRGVSNLSGKAGVQSSEVPPTLLPSLQALMLSPGRPGQSPHPADGPGFKREWPVGGMGRGAEKWGTVQG